MSEIPIGLYSELSGMDYPSIRDLISDKPIEGKEAVLRYMKKAPVVCVAACSPFYDVFTGAKIQFPEGLVGRSDGKYGWQSDTIYYFDKYNLKLPDEFIQHALGTNK